ncbi:hypothetical protein cyc_00971 [Cyclospora cayetanensis]|uniref:Uncharacterized protein n=1 Tax=Cyclospora cayetanensis TaxID=88456 RepID=A0A1D3D976_9EIME|nr:hypothetical protein cyc_00971 [Cyclospora cayetanensis]
MPESMQSQTEGEREEGVDCCSNVCPRSGGMHLSTKAKTSPSWSWRIYNRSIFTNEHREARRKDSSQQPRRNGEGLMPPGWLGRHSAHNPCT